MTARKVAAMKMRIGTLLVLLLAADCLLAALQSPPPPGAAPPTRSTAGAGTTSVATRGRVAPGFVPNRGQAASAIRYSTRLSGYTALFTDRAAVFAFARHALRLQFVGASGPLGIEGDDKLPATVNYLVGSDRTRWRTGLPTYGGIVYRELWPGIDLAFHDAGSEIKYELTVSPGARTDAARFEYRGAERVFVNADGDLVIDTPHGSLVDHRPRSYQKIDGKEVAVETRFVVDTATHQYGFAIGAYDRSRPLVIDPGLVYFTQLGGSSDDYPRAVAVDGSGAAYVTGQTSSLDFPDELAWVATLRDWGLIVYGVSERFSDTGIFVTKLSPGGGVIYTTFLGSGEARAIAVQAGNIYVTGVADPGTSLPATASFGPSTGATRAFVAKLVPYAPPEGGAENANVVWVEGVGLGYSVMIGGTGPSEATGLAVDGEGQAYVVGRTESADFPTTAGAFQPALAGLAGSSDAFALAVDASGTLIYSTLLGGAADDAAHGVAVDAGGNAYVAGTTQSVDFPATPGAWSVTALGGSDGFVTRLNATGSAAVYSTYLGGTSDDQVGGIAVDAAGQAFAAGTTGSLDFPVTAGAFQSAMNSAPDGFITGLDAAGSTLVHSTFLGGNNADALSSMALNQFGEVYVFGTSRSTDFPTTEDAVSRTLAGGVNDDAVLARFDASGTLRYATYLGGGGTESAAGVAVDPRGDAYVVGHVDAGSPLPPGANGYVARIIPRPNLALQKPATASSSESGEGPENAFDGSLATQWSSHWSGSPIDPQWIAVDLGASIAIERVWLWWRNAYGSDYQVQFSNDGESWSIVKAIDPGASDLTFSPILARYVRVSFREDSQVPLGNSLLELEVYAPLESAPAPSFNSPPNVSITSPPAVATFTAPVNVNLAADAADSDGAIAYVDFLVNGRIHIRDTTVPYGGTLGVSTDGTFTVTAIAFDSAGIGTISRPVTITVQPNSGPPPAITIANPLNGATFTAPVSLTLRADVVDTGGIVARVGFLRCFSVGSNSWECADVGPADDTAPYSVEWTTSTAGTYQFSAYAYDIAGGIATLAQATITVRPPNSPPTVNMTSPPNGSVFTAPATITVSADAADADGSVARVEFFANGSLIATDPTAPYNLSWTASPAATYTLTAQAVDAAGASATSAPVSVTIERPNQPPMASVGGPYSGVVSQTVAFNGSGSSDPDGDPLTYQWTFGDGATGTGASSPHAYAAAGSYTVTLVVSDGIASSTGTTSVSVVEQSLTVTTPNTAATWDVGSTQTIAWTHNLGAGSTVALDVSRDGGMSWTAIAGSVTNTGATWGSFAWVVSNPPTASARIRVKTASGAVSDVSDASFTIKTPNQPPMASVGGPYSGVVSQAVAFSGSGSSDPDGDPLTYQWTFGDGATGTGAGAPHAYGAAGSYPVTLVVSDGIASSTSTTNVSVVGQSLAVTAPNTAANWGVGSTQTIAWTHNLGAGSTVALDVSRNGGATWTAIAASVTNTGPASGSYAWVVKGPVTTSARVRVRTASGAASDVNDSNFTIAAAFITVTSPSNALQWTIGSSYAITWNHNLGTMSSVKLEISRGGSIWSLINGSVQSSGASTGSYNWTVSGPATSTARIRVTWTTNSGVKDPSNGSFVIR